MKVLRTKYQPLILGLFLIILIKAAEYLFDLVFGNGDGIIEQFYISRRLNWIVGYILIAALFFFSRRAKSRVLTTVSVIFFVILVTENLAAYRVSMNTPDYGGSFTKGFITGDENLGFKPLPATEVQAVKRIGRKTSYSVIYTTDSSSRRILVSNPDTASQIAVFFGGSIAFGEGVNNHETLPDRFVQNAPGYFAFNYGFIGYGPNHMLAILAQDTISVTGRPDQSLCVYVYHNDHAAIVGGSMHYLDSLTVGSPYYSYNPKAGLERNTSFIGGRTFKTKFLLLLGKSSFLQAVGLDILGRNKDVLTLTTELIHASAKEFDRKFRNGRFYVLIAPGSRNDIVPLLHEGITVFDYSALFENPEYLLEPYGQLPNARGYAKMAEQFISDLQIASN